MRRASARVAAATSFRHHARLVGVQSAQSACVGLDDFGLVAHAASLQSQSNDFAAWQKVSHRGEQILAVTNAPGVLVWVLDAIAQADLHPRQRGELAFLQSFRQAILSAKGALDALSDDELVLAWRSFERLQLLDKQSSLMFFRAATMRTVAGIGQETNSGGRRRCSRFSLRNWVRTAAALRGFLQHHPLYMDFVESVALRLLVERSGDLLRQGMQLEAFHAVSSMTPLSSRQMHRITAALHALLPEMQGYEIATVPRLCVRAELADESLFEAFVDRLRGTFATLEVNELTAMWRALLRWNVGPPGMRRCAAVLLAEGWLPAWTSHLPPRSLVQSLRAFGRLDGSALRAAGSGEAADALAGVLVAVLEACTPATLQTFNSAELLLLTNALGQIARGWSWLEAGPRNADVEGSRSSPRQRALAELGRCAADVGTATRWQMRVTFGSEGHSFARCRDESETYTARDLALVAQAQARLARRLPELDLTDSLTEICDQLAIMARSVSQPAVLDDQLEPTDAHVCEPRSAEQDDVLREVSTAEDVVGDDGNAGVPTYVLSTVSMLLMLSSRGSPHSGMLQSELAASALGCLQAWLPAAVATAAPSRPAVHKAAAAASVLGSQLLRIDDDDLLNSQLARPLAESLRELLTASLSSNQEDIVGESRAEQAALLETWHLDGCLHALAVSAALDNVLGLGTAGPDPELEVVVVAEVCHRRAVLTEQSVRFWSSKLCERGVLLRGGGGLPRRLCAELLQWEGEEPLMNPGAASALRDMAFLLQQPVD